MTIGQRVRERRMALGLSQENLAHAAGLSWGAVQRLEAGKIVDPHYSTLEGIAHTLGTTVAELVGEKEPVPLDEAPREAGRPEVEGPDPLGGWIRHALSEGDFALEFERAKSSQELADELDRAKDTEVTERNQNVVTLQEQDAPPAAIQSARRDRAVAKAQLTAVRLLAVELWRGHDVSGMDPRTIVTDVIHTQSGEFLVGGTTAQEPRESA